MKKKAVKQKKNWMYLVIDSNRVDRKHASGDYSEVHKAASRWVTHHTGDEKDRLAYAKQIRFFRFDADDPQNQLHSEVETFYEIHLTEPRTK